MKWQRRALIVDDEPLLASLIAKSFEASGFDAFIAHSAVEARTCVEERDPDVAIIDINLGSGPNGVAFGRWVHATHRHVALVFLSRYSDPHMSGKKEWGIPPGSTFLSKDHVGDPVSLIHAVEEALGQNSLPARHDLDFRSRFEKLTPTQLEILTLVAQGLTNAAIATRRGTSERTVEQRLQVIYESLGIAITRDMNPRVQAIRMFIEAGGLVDETQSMT